VDKDKRHQRGTAAEQDKKRKTADQAEVRTFTDSDG
jgi:hypothetical protein